MRSSFLIASGNLWPSSPATASFHLATNLSTLAAALALAGCGTVTMADGDAAPVDGAAPVDAAPAPDADPAAPDAAPVPCRVSWYKGRAPNRDVWTSLPDGSDAKAVTTTTSDDFGGDWSPDGQWLLVGSNREGNFDVLKVSPDGTQTINLTKSLDDALGDAPDTPIDWSPDGGKIAFFRSGAIWVMASDGTLHTSVATLPNIQGPTWSPDGRSILFSSRQVNHTNVDLFLVSAGGGMPRQLTTTADAKESSGVFSPDGNKIMFSRQEASNFDVWVMASDGSSPVNLTPNTPSSESLGSWFPDGATVLINSDREGGHKVYRVPVTGGAPVRLTDNALSGVIAGDWSPNLSPDGSRILFTRYLDDPRQTLAGSVAVDGTDLRTWPMDDTTALAISWAPCSAVR